MLTPHTVLEVARTSRAATIPGTNRILTIDDLIRATTSIDWESGYYELKPVAALRVTDEMNASMKPKQPAAKAIRSIASGRTNRRRPKVITGEVVEGPKP